MIEQVLEERGARYGKFINHATIAQGLQDIIRKMPSWDTMDPDMKQALVVITDKIARMGNGDPWYIDNWVDICGYSQLIVTRLNDINIPEF